jgi:uncharacterized protein (DUF305 family)
MIKKIKLVFILVTLMYTITACNDNTTTSTDTDKKDTTISQTDKKDSGDMKMDNGLMTSMNTMMDKTSSMKMSGDFDMDFASMMIEHHKGAIDMSEQELKSGTDDKLKGMAQKIITEQKVEIAKLQEIVKNSKASKMKMGDGELEKSMSDMKTAMSGMKMTGNMDKDYAMMMISHHESAVSMFKMELKNGMNAQLKQIAQKGISDQTKEINEFKSWMDANK